MKVDQIEQFRDELQSLIAKYDGAVKTIHLTIPLCRDLFDDLKIDRVILHQDFRTHSDNASAVIEINLSFE